MMFYRLILFIFNLDKFNVKRYNLKYGADLALDMLNENVTLAFARGDNNETGLHLLARKHSVCGCQSLVHRKNPLHLCKCIYNY